MITPILKLTDGTTSISLVTPETQKGVHLLDWIPGVANYKGGGIRRNNSRADGQALVGKQWENVTEEFRVLIDGEDQDAVMRTLQDLRRLFEKASDYWTAPQQDKPIWIEASGSCETETRYSVVVLGHMPQDGNPHAQPFFASDPSVLTDDEPGFLISVERQPWWTSEQPGTEACVQTSAQQKNWDIGAWSLNTAQPAGRVFDIVELSSGWMLAGDDANVWRTNTGAAVWTAATTPPAGQVYAFAEHTDGYTYCITANGLYRSNDNGDTWALRNANLTGTGFSTTDLLSATNGYLYASAALAGTGQGTYRSNDGGTTWATLSQVCYGHLYQTASGTILATPSDRVCRSADGVTFEQVSPSDVVQVLQLASGVILGAALSGRVYRSEDDGLTWVLYSTTEQTNDGNQAIALDGLGRIVMATNRAGAGYIQQGNGDGDGWRTIALAGYQGLFSLQLFSGNGALYAGEGAGAAGDIVVSSTLAEKVTVGRTATCNSEVFLANKANTAQLTHILVFDASGPTYTSQFPAAAFPYDLLPSPFAVGDICYFGIETSVLDAGPFSSLAFDIEQDTRTLGTTMVWEYSQGGAAWNTLNVQDGTKLGVPFALTGVNSVHWTPPSDWASDTVNGVTALWVRLRVTGLTLWLQSPTQANRDVYTINWAGIDIDDEQIIGDIPALLRIKARNRSDEDRYSFFGSTDLLENRVIVALRSLSRGADFTPALNLADEQNPTGISVDIGTGSTFVDKIGAPSGRMVQHDVSAGGSTGLSNYVDAATINLGSGISSEYNGGFHAFLRVQLIENTGTPVADADRGVQVRLDVRSGTGGFSKTTKHRRFVGWDKTGETFKDWQLFSFGRVDFPVSDLLRQTEQSDEARVVVQVSASSALALNVNCYDLWLIPVDEWAGDFIDAALEDDSGIGNSDQLDIDSTTYQKRRIRALVRGVDSSELVRGSYQPITPGPAILQANADQRLWFLTARAAYQGEHTGLDNASVLTDDYADFIRAGVKIGQTIFNITDGSSGIVTARTRTTITATLSGGTDNDWDIGDDYLVICNGIYTSEPWNCHSIQLERNSRYLSFRGER